MKTYLLTWNPKRWQWDDLPQQANKNAAGEVIQRRWSCGRTKTVRKGDRVFLIRVGLEPRGVIAAGWCTSEPYLAAHWDGAKRSEGEQALYLDAEWERLLNPEVDEPLLLSKLQAEKLQSFNWTPQASGTRIPDVIAEGLEQLWAGHAGASSLGPVFVDDEIRAFEGEQRLALIRHRKREQKLRAAKIEQTLRDGAGRLRCEVPGCGFDFFEVYEELGKDFAFVHHLKALGDLIAPRETSLDDLAIVCGNCHAMIHRGGGCRPLEDLIKLRE